jgi:hypothetical protein
LGGANVQVVGHVADAVFVEDVRNPAEGVGLHHIAADFEESRVHALDGRGLADEQVFGAAFKLRAAVIVYGQILRLKVRAHRAVENNDAVLQSLEEIFHLF